MLFTDVWMAPKAQQDVFWEAFSSMVSIWSKQPKLDVTSLPKSSYWVHPTSLEPNQSQTMPRVWGHV